MANALKRDGVKKGDRVAIYMPVSPLLVASMLACARIGAIHRLGGQHYHTPTCNDNQIHYCIARKFGGELNLAVWQSIL